MECFNTVASHVGLNNAKKVLAKICTLQNDENVKYRQLHYKL